MSCPVETEIRVGLFFPERDWNCRGWHSGTRAKVEQDGRANRGFAEYR